MKFLESYHVSQSQSTHELHEQEGRMSPALLSPNVNCDDSKALATVLIASRHG